MTRFIELYMKDGVKYKGKCVSWIFSINVQVAWRDQKGNIDAVHAQSGLYNWKIVQISFSFG